jgi:hypothetical protein
MLIRGQLAIGIVAYEKKGKYNVEDSVSSSPPMKRFLESILG